MNTARLYARLRKRSIAGDETVIVEQRETRLAIQNLALVLNRDTGVVNMCYQETHVTIRPLASPLSCAGSACHCSSFHRQTRGVPATVAADERGT